MKIKLKELRSLIRETLSEVGGPTGSIRNPGSKSSGRQVKLGKIEDDNKELSAIEVDEQFPGALDAWVEIVPDMYPEFPFSDAYSIRKNCVYFKIKNELRVAFKDMPSVELMKWVPEADDWFEL